ncbi:MAG TPA: hypothetical protein VEA99_00055 [Gemmatimonadaceae bacterium]|nr:hypothetical protein [Gemmatimonadaceae bacterium]
MSAADLFIGAWDLVPELSLYAAGSPPEAGRYVVSVTDDGRLELTARWRAVGATDWQSVTFGGAADGTRQALPASSDAPPGAPDAFALTRVDARTLDSSAWRGERLVAYARRVASEDGALLAVVQESVAPNDVRLRNFQVYRRATS